MPVSFGTKGPSWRLLLLAETVSRVLRTRGLPFTWRRDTVLKLLEAIDAEAEPFRRRHQIWPAS